MTVTLENTLLISHIYLFWTFFFKCLCYINNDKLLNLIYAVMDMKPPVALSQKEHD